MVPFFQVKSLLNLSYTEITEIGSHPFTKKPNAIWLIRYRTFWPLSVKVHDVLEYQTPVRLENIVMLPS